MRFRSTAFLILGFFLPLVIQAEPFGTTEMTVYDTDFLPAPEGPPPADPAVPAVPPWVALISDPDPDPTNVLVPILPLELPS